MAKKSQARKASPKKRKSTRRGSDPLIYCVGFDQAEFGARVETDFGESLVSVVGAKILEFRFDGPGRLWLHVEIENE